MNCPRTLLAENAYWLHYTDEHSNLLSPPTYDTAE